MVFIGSYRGYKRSSGREFLDMTVTGVGDEKIPATIYRNCSRGIELSFTAPLTAFEHGGGARSDGLQRWSGRECCYKVLKLPDILVGDIQDVKASSFFHQPKAK